MLLAEPTISDVSRLFRALGDEPRLRILRILLEAGRPLAQKAIADAAGLSQANTSKHMIVLASVGLVRREPHGNQVLFTPLAPLVTEVCDRVCNHVAGRIKTSYLAIL